MEGLVNVCNMTESKLRPTSESLPASFNKLHTVIWKERRSKCLHHNKAGQNDFLCRRKSEYLSIPKTY